MGVIERDIFLWLKRPTIAQMKEVLRWAHKRVLRADIRYRKEGRESYPSDKDFESILKHVDRTAKLFFRIIVRKGMNDMLRMDSPDQKDLLDFFISVTVDRKYYDMNLYVSAKLLGVLKRKFPMVVGEGDSHEKA